MNRAARDAAIALRQSMHETLPRVGYTGDGTSVPVMRQMSPVTNRHTDATGFLCMDAESIGAATYVVAVEPNVDANADMSDVVMASVRRFYAEWN